MQAPAGSGKTTAVASLAAAGPASAAPLTVFADSVKAPMIAEVKNAADGTMLQIRGANFSSAPRVFLGTMPGNPAVTLATPGQVDVVVPADLAPGTYLLAPVNDPNKGDNNLNNIDEFLVTIGAAGPAGP